MFCTTTIETLRYHELNEKIFDKNSNLVDSNFCASNRNIVNKEKEANKCNGLPMAFQVLS